MQTVSFLYVLFVVFAVFFSYFFVDFNFPLKSDLVRSFVETDELVKTLMYVSTIVTFFGFYSYVLALVHRGKIVSRDIWLLLFINILLLLSYPAFSFDIFNYIATAKVTFLYGENPYIVMPIELSHEPLLAFMHAANKIALYGPSWIILTAIPYFTGFGNLFLTIFTFKLFNFLFYIGTSYIIFRLSKNNTFKLTLFALNPLVIIETLVSGHNDIVMVFFALLAFYLINKRLFIFSTCALLISIFIKFATVVLVPIFIYTFVQSIRSKKVNWDKIWLYSSYLLFFIFLLSPIREEMYSWYFIWPFAFLVLTKNLQLIQFVGIFLSVGLLLRFTPFVYTKDWGGITPMVKQIATFGFVFFGFAFYPFFKKKYL